MDRMNLVFLSIAVVTGGGFASIGIFGVYGLLWLLALPCYVILWNKRVMNWLEPYERIIPCGNEFKITNQKECDSK